LRRTAVRLQGDGEEAVRAIRGQRSRRRSHARRGGDLRHAGAICPRRRSHATGRRAGRAAL